MTDEELASLFRHYPTMFTLDPRHVAQRVFFLLRDNHKDSISVQGKDSHNHRGSSSNNSDDKKSDDGVDDDGVDDDGADNDEDDDDDDDDDDDRPAPIAPPPFLRNMGYSVDQVIFDSRPCYSNI